MNDAVTVKVFPGAELFEQAILSRVEIDEAENGLFLGILGRLKQAPSANPPFMGAIMSRGQVLGAALDGKLNLIITRGIGPGTGALIQALRGAHVEIGGVVGPRDEAEQFATAWARATGCRLTLAMDQGLYQLTKVVRPPSVPGSMRPMQQEDVELVADWILGFTREATPHEPMDLAGAKRNAASRVGANMTYLWIVNESPVAMASLTRPTAHGITINGVYTPPATRRQGYATALVAAVSGEGLARGKDFCTLYTDMANPTSNSIYQKVGYRPLGPSRNYRFSYA